MMLAGEWYENVDVWAIVVGAVIAVGIGWLSAWATLRSANPKRRLAWSELTQSRLLHGGATVQNSITVHHAGQALTDPHVVMFQLVNIGTHDVTRAHFADEKPIVFDFEVPVKEVLSVECHNDGMVPVEVEKRSPNQVVVNPGLIKKGQMSLVTVLVEGEPKLSARASLVDVDLSKGEVYVRDASFWADVLSRVSFNPFTLPFSLAQSFLATSLERRNGRAD